MKRKVLFLGLALLSVTQILTAKLVDVTSTYMKNYTKPFATTENKLMTGTDRFRELAAPWKSANTYGTMGMDQTSFHIDSNKNGELTITSKYDGFVSSFEDVKVYQVLDLPTGEYTLSTSRGQDQSGASYTYLVANLGSTGIPDIANLSKALASEALSGSLSITFSLKAPAKVSVGYVASFPETTGAGLCISLGSMKLLKYEEGADYEPLKQLIAQAESMTPDKYPLGIEAGQYDEFAWEDFEIARDAAILFVEAGETAEQATVDTHYDALKKAIEDLNKSLVAPIKFSNSENEYWYKLEDRRVSPYFLHKGYYFGDRAMVTQTPGDSDEYLFKFVKDEKDPTVFIIFCKASVDNLTLLRSNGPHDRYMMFDKGATTTWKFEPSSIAQGYFRIVKVESFYLNGGVPIEIEGAIYGDLARNLGYVSIPTSDDSPIHDWKITAVSTGVKTLTANDLGVYVNNRKILSRNAEDKLSVFTINGVKINTNVAVQPGIYIVKVAGKEGAAKILVQ